MTIQAHELQFDVTHVAKLKSRVYGHMLHTRDGKYEKWVHGIERYKRWVLMAERYLVPLGVDYLKDARKRIEMVEVMYVALRIADDVVDKDLALPDGFSSSAAYVRSLIAFVDSNAEPLNPVEELLAYVFHLGRELYMDMRPAVKDILESLVFDAERQGSPELCIFDRKTLEHHFYLLDIRGTIGGCLIVAREPAEAQKMLDPLGKATRIRYDLRDYKEDIGANYCNVASEDVLAFKISDVRAFDSPEMRKWRHHEAERGLNFLIAYGRVKYDIPLHPLTRIILRQVYEKPTEDYLNKVFWETARTTS